MEGGKGGEAGEDGEGGIVGKGEGRDRREVKEMLTYHQTLPCFFCEVFKFIRE